MNLADILLPKRRFYRPTAVESADCAESQQLQGLKCPQIVAESCGELEALEVIRNNPQQCAESETLASTTFPHNPHNPQDPMAEIEKPLLVTVDHFRLQGVELLANDLAFLLWHLPKGTTERNNAIKAYIETWQAAMAGESMVHRKANRGRFAANTWLRERGV